MLPTKVNSRVNISFSPSYKYQNRNTELLISKYLCYILDAFQKTIDRFGKLNIVINNAGIMSKYITSWEQAIDLNYVSFSITF